MIQWVTSVFRRCPTRGRYIFKYWDGASYVFADPLATLMALENHPKYRHDLHRRLTSTGDKEMSQIICEVMRDVFGVKAYDPTTCKGLTIAELCALHGQFFGYLASLLPDFAESPEESSGENFNATNDMATDPANSSATLC